MSWLRKLTRPLSRKRVDPERVTSVDGARAIAERDREAHTPDPARPPDPPTGRSF